MLYSFCAFTFFLLKSAVSKPPFLIRVLFGYNFIEEKSVIQIEWLCGGGEEAEKVIEVLLSKQLIACANVFEVRSYYEWKGKKEKSLEVKVVMKTLKECFEDVALVIKQESLYEVPCITSTRVKQVNARYLAWVQSCVKSC